MVVEELQILVGCDASTAEKVLTELETRLNRFVKQSASSMQNAKAIRAQAAAEREALKTEAARVKYANDIAKSNLALEAAQRKAARAAEMLNEKTRKISASASEQSNAFEQMADGQCESLNKVAETAEEVERRLDETMSKVPAGFGTNAYKGRNPEAEAEALVPKEAQPVSRDLAEKFVKEANTAELFNMKLDELYNKLQRLLGVEEKLSEGGGTGQGLERVRGQILSVTEQIQKMQEKAKTAFETLPKTAKKAAAKTQGVFAKLGKAIGKILSRMIIWRAINAVIMSVQEGLNNMAQASKKANATLSQLQSGFTYVKNSIASAFMPVLQSLVPIITRVANAIAGLFNTIGAFFAKLRGQDTFTKAVYVQQDYAASLGKTNKAAKTLKNTLASFDQINLIQNEGGGGGGESNLVGDMFKEVKIPAGVSKFGQAILDFFNRVKKKIPTQVINRFKESIGKLSESWKRFKDAWTQFKDNPAMKKFTDFVEWLIANVAATVITDVSIAIENLSYVLDIFTGAMNGDWKAALDGFWKILVNILDAVVQTETMPAIRLIDKIFGTDFEQRWNDFIKLLKESDFETLIDKIRESTNKMDSGGISSKFAAIGKAVELFKLQIDGLVALLNGDFDTAWRKLKEYVLTAVDFIVQLVAMPAIKIADKIFGTNFAGEWNDAIAAMKNNSVGDALKEGIEEADEATIGLKNEVQDIKDAFNGVEPTANTAMSGTAKAMKDAQPEANNLKEKVAQMCDAIKLKYGEVGQSSGDVANAFGSANEKIQTSFGSLSKKADETFSKDSWDERTGVIKTSLSKNTDEATTKWDNDMSSWWKDKVEPWFQQNKWINSMQGVKEAFAAVFKGAVNAAITLINKFVNWVNDKMHITIKPLVIGGKTIFDGADFNLFTLKTIPLLAQGGLAYGDTLARVGEYANAKNNPEVIAPLDKLQSIMGGLNDKDTQTIIALLKRIADKDVEIALYPSAKLGRIVNQSVNMNNIAIGNV